MLKKLILLTLCAAIWGCAGVGNGVSRTDEGTFLGMASGTYSNVYYKADEGDLYLAFENTSAFTMKNLIVVVEQKTASGSAETQTGVATLRTRALKQLTFKIPAYSTGDVTVKSYFLMMPLAIPMGAGSPGIDNDVFPETGEDTVTFKIVH